MNAERIDYSPENNRIFVFALVFSIVFHALVVVDWPFYGHLFSLKSQINDVQITYLKAEKEPLPVLPQKEPEVASKRSSPQEESMPPVKMVTQEPAKSLLPKTETAAPGRIAQARKEEIKTEKKPLTEPKPTVVIKEPIIQKPETTAFVNLKDLQLVPASYSQTVRGRIIGNLDSEKAEAEGDVYIRFVITSKGELKELSIIDERSTKNGLLRAAAFEAVKNSSPFPRFPKDITIPEVTFTCQISFIRN